MAAEIVHNHQVASPQNWHQQLLDISEAFAIDRSLKTQGALMPSQRSAATKVMVFQWPWAHHLVEASYSRTGIEEIRSYVTLLVKDVRDGVIKPYGRQTPIRLPQSWLRSDRGRGHAQLAVNSLTLSQRGSKATIGLNEPVAE